MKQAPQINRKKKICEWRIAGAWHLQLAVPGNKENRPVLFPPSCSASAKGGGSPCPASCLQHDPTNPIQEAHTPLFGIPWDRGPQVLSVTSW